MRSVAVAVNGGSGAGRVSRRAVQWAVENVMPQADRFILVHVMPTIASIPTPSGEYIPVTDLDADVAAAYIQDVREKFDQIFVPFKKLCKASTVSSYCCFYILPRLNWHRIQILYMLLVETLLLEDDNPATALLRYVSEADIQILVLGTDSPNFITRKLKGPGIPTTVLRSAPDTCDVYLIARDRIISKLADSSSSPSHEISSRHPVSSQGNIGDINAHISREITGLHSSTTLPELLANRFPSVSLSEWSFIGSQTSSPANSLKSLSINESNSESFRDDAETASIRSFDSMASAQIEQPVMQEIKQLQLELRNTISMYKEVCEELALHQNKVHLLSAEYVEESKRVQDSLKREETLRMIAAVEKEKYLKVMKELEEARIRFAKESYERQIAELSVAKETIERRRIIDTMLSSDKRYRKYTMDEIKDATNNFSEDLLIGEGGYGKVYKCSLDHTTVAVKVLHDDAFNKKEEFLKEVEILSQLHHPHMVLLLGACPETGCIVYEYLENGSLEDYLFKNSEKPPLPWFIRFRIVFEVACGLSFLHNSKPEPIVHRDMKPGNILLDRNYVSKISDVGLAKLISDAIPDNITEYRESVLAGTLHYMDPEYQRTGTVRPKSDVYALGVITLQLITARQARGVILAVENAIKNGSFSHVLDKSAGDWPLTETEELAQIALRCTALKCRERPDLDTEVLPLLKRICDVANAIANVGRNSSTSPPSQYYCPILQEIMDDPHIAADGFTYEHRAIKAWLSKHNVSPVTKLTMQHSTLIPNHTLRSAIQEWRSGQK